MNRTKIISNEELFKLYRRNLQLNNEEFIKEIERTSKLDMSRIKDKELKE
jgi:hypothetical protein